MKVKNLDHDFPFSKMAYQDENGEAGEENTSEWESRSFEQVRMFVVLGF